MSKKISNKERRAVAFHEAGHVVMRAFCGRGFTHIQLVSILPDASTWGRVRVERSDEDWAMKTLPHETRLIFGRRVLLTLMAGRAAELQAKNLRASLLDPDWHLAVAPESTDTFRARQTAELMAYKYMPAGRILKVTEAWTRQILRRPDFQRSLRAVASLLVAKEEIRDPHVLDGLCRDVYHKSFLPEWRSRLQRMKPKQNTRDVV